MFLVHVKTGKNASVAVAQLHGQFGIAFHIEPQIVSVERRQQKYFVADAKDNDVWPKRKRFLRFGLRQTIFAKGFNVYFGLGFEDFCFL